MREVQLSEIRQCQNNDNKMIGVVFQRLHPSLISLCYRYLGNTDDAEDVVMVSWMKVIQRIQDFKFEHPLSFYSYLKRICIHECLNLLRSKNNFNLISLHNLSELDEPFSDDIHQLDTKILLEIISQLPIGYRTVFNLFAIEGHSHAEIASMLQITESTSKSQFRKARLNLMQYIHKLNEERKANER
jgi:RNA polymerase sigma-70 factor (ECF subfamily)